MSNKLLHRPITILIADDDEDDRMLISEAMEEVRLKNEIRFVKDGEELLNYLMGQGAYVDEATRPFPGLILLDLNMPKVDGREALKFIKSDAKLRRIPVIVLTTSQAEEDILRTYDLGVNSFIMKPISFGALVEVVKELGRYWLQFVELPTGELPSSKTNAVKSE